MYPFTLEFTCTVLSAKVEPMDSWKIGTSLGLTTTAVTAKRGDACLACAAGSARPQAEDVSIGRAIAIGASHGWIPIGVEASRFTPDRIAMPRVCGFCHGNSSQKGIDKTYHEGGS